MTALFFGSWAMFAVLLMAHELREVLRSMTKTENFQAYARTDGPGAYRLALACALISAPLLTTYAVGDFLWRLMRYGAKNIRAFPCWLRMYRHVSNGGKPPGSAWTIHRCLGAFLREGEVPWFRISSFYLPSPDSSLRLAIPCRECSETVHYPHGWFHLVSPTMPKELSLEEAMAEKGVKLISSEAMCPRCVREAVVERAVVPEWYVKDDPVEYRSESDGDRAETKLGETG